MSGGVQKLQDIAGSSGGPDPVKATQPPRNVDLDIKTNKFTSQLEVSQLYHFT